MREKKCKFRESDQKKTKSNFRRLGIIQVEENTHRGEASVKYIITEKKLDLQDRILEFPIVAQW